MGAPLEIICPLCGKETLVRREPVYEGFQKVGETCFCTECGGEVPADDGVQVVPRKKLNIFSDDDKPEAQAIFGEDERQRCCRYCQHYVLNPFTQRCGLHGRDVESTDLCFNFARCGESEEELTGQADGSE